MAQVTIYLDDDTLERMKAAAEAEGLSQSRWVARLIRDRTTDEWPASVRQALGTWNGFPTADELREGQGEDVPRETL